MNKFIIIIFVSITSFCQAQNFYVKDSADIITVNVPLKFKSYTFNQYSLTDTSLIITSPREKLDLIIRDLDKSQNILLSFPPSYTRIKGKEHYEIKTGEPVIFTVYTDQVYTLLSDQDLAFHFIIDEGGDLQELPTLPIGKKINLPAGRTYGFKYVPVRIGNTELHLSLFQGDRKIESKEFPVSVLAQTVKFQVNTEVVNSGCDKIINYKIISSAPLPSDLHLSLKLTIEINGFESNIDIENIIMPNSQVECSGQYKKIIRGRYPRSFTIKNTCLRILSFIADPNYKIEIMNL